jgi:hypothetical protein
LASHCCKIIKIEMKYKSAEVREKFLIEYAKINAGDKLGSTTFY